MLEIIPFEASDVLVALKVLRQAASLPANTPLASLLNVQGVEPTGRAQTELRIFQLLSTLSGRQLRYYRAAQGFSIRKCKIATSSDLQHDFRAVNAELEAWSLLYFRYIGVELDLSVERIACLVAQTTKTLQRRQQVGLARLTQLLGQHEQHVRRRLQETVIQSYLSVLASRRVSNHTALNSVGHHVANSFMLRSLNTSLAHSPGELHVTATAPQPQNPPDNGSDLVSLFGIVPAESSRL